MKPRGGPRRGLRATRGYRLRAAWDAIEPLRWFFIIGRRDRVGGGHLSRLCPYLAAPTREPGEDRNDRCSGLDSGPEPPRKVAGRFRQFLRRRHRHVRARRGVEGAETCCYALPHCEVGCTCCNGTTVERVLHSSSLQGGRVLQGTNRIQRHPRRSVRLASLSWVVVALTSCSDDAGTERAPANQRPVATPNSVTVAEDGSVGIRLRGTDSDGTVVGYRVATPPASGAFSGTAPDLTYAPEADFSGRDEFTFTVTDDDGAVSAPAAVTIDVTPVNDPPTALAQSAEVVGGESVDIVLAGADIDGVVVTYEVATQPAHGGLTGTPPELNYAPDPGYAGMDAFTFTVMDDEGAVSAVAQVAIEVVLPCQGDRSVLETLFSSTGGDGWANNEGWLVAEDLSDWYGIDADGDCVTAIRLGGNRLRGTLPWELGALAMLVHLDLSRGACHVDDECTLHALMGEIPWELGSLAKLELLDLSGHGYASRDGGSLARIDGQGLTGPIPIELGNLTDLRMLRLGTNALVGPIPVELANMRNLTELYLNSNELFGPIPTEMGNLTNLVALSLKHNALSGPIPLGIARLTRLAHLSLLDNRLSGPIPAELRNLTSLGNLSLGSNDLWGRIPAELGDLTSLRSLSLRYNELSGPIPVEIGNLTNLAALYLGSNALSGPIPVEIGNLTNLVRLTLDRNELSGGVPVELAGLVKLGFLALNRNRLAGQLPSAMTSLTELKTFWFAFNDGLCAPGDDDFQAWLRGIRDRDDGPTCE